AGFSAPAEVPVSVLVAAGIQVSQVRYRWGEGSNENATVSSAPFSTTLHSLPAKSYDLTAQAVDASGRTSITDPVLFLVLQNQQPSPAPLIAVERDGENVKLSVPTNAGVVCHIEYSDSLTATDWKLLQTLTGDGSKVTVTDALTN